MSIARRALVLLVISMSATAVIAAPLVVPAASATSVADAEAEVTRLGRDVEIAAEQYNDAQAQLGPLQQQLAIDTAREGDQQRHIDTLRGQMRDMAVAEYKRGGVDPSLAVLFSEDPVALIDHAAVMEAVSRSQGAALGDYEAAIVQLATDRAVTAATLAEVQALEQQREALKVDIERQLSDAQSSLVTAQRAQAERAAAALAASRSRQVAAPGSAGAAPGAAVPSGAVPSGGGGPVGSGTSCADVGATAPNDRVAAVLDFACAQLGKPYQWAAAGPDSYDCSGFTMTSWAQAGVSLPHSSRMQYSGGVKVDRANLQPGDLVFFYSPISHVGIYLGNDYFIAAPSTGDVVKVRKIYSPYTGAVRP